MNRNVIIYLLFSLFVLLVSWEEQQVHSIASVHHEIGSKEAIRLRILANSDAIEDQIVKRAIRDRVNQAIAEWVQDVDRLEEAKATIIRHLPEIERIVHAELVKHETVYPYDVRFDKAAFPTKVYGDIVYPAGVYDAVVITIGAGLGKNWWCVLFPPLCFVDMSGDEEAHELEEERQAHQEEEIHVSFFLVELLSSLLERW